jgi:hypothetical protein
MTLVDYNLSAKPYQHGIGAVQEQHAKSLLDREVTER